MGDTIGSLGSRLNKDVGEESDECPLLSLLLDLWRGEQVPGHAAGSLSNTMLSPLW